MENLAAKSLTFVKSAFCVQVFGPPEFSACVVALKMPDFNGTVRVVAQVFGENQYGGADTETVVRAPLVAEVSAALRQAARFWPRRDSLSV